METFFNKVVNSVSNFLQPSNSEETESPPTSPRQQTAFSTTAVDLTKDSPPPRFKRSAPSHAESRPDQVRPPKKPRLTDEQRLIPARYPSPHGATPIPNPNTHRPSEQAFGFKPSTMPKPGAQHSFNPIGGRTTYSNKGKTSAPRPSTEYSSFFEQPNELPPLPYVPSPAAKRRKTADYVDIEDDNDESMSSRHQSSPPVAHSSPSQSSQRHSSSRRSVGSGHNVGARSTLQAQNEYEDCVKVTASRRKTARVPGKRQNGCLSSPIVLDDEPGQPTTAKRLQLHAFSQGNPKQIFRSEGMPRINQSTELTRGEPELNLRDKFKRACDPITDNRPDELTMMPVTNQQGRPKSTTVRSKSSPQKWPLQYVGTNGGDWTGPSLSIQSEGALDEWRIVSEDDNGEENLVHQVRLRQITNAIGDKEFRIRLEGSQLCGNPKYYCDLQFINSQQLHKFKTIVAPRTTTGVVKERDSKWMTNTFETSLKTTTNQTTTISSKQGNSLGVLQAQARDGEQKTRRPQSMDSIQNKAFVEAGNGSGRRSTRPTRSTRAHSPQYIDIEEKPPKSKYSVDIGLGAPWKRQLTYGSGRRRAVIDFADLTRLDEEEYLNDQLIDFYIIYLFNHHNVPKDRVYFFNCHFFATLTRNRGPINYAGVARWTAREDLFNYDYIVVPICQDFHWFLAIICNVRNIARKPVIETVEESPSSQSKTLNKSIGSDIVSEADVSSEIEHPTNEGVGAAPKTQPTVEQTPLDEEEEASLLDPIDPNAVSEPVKNSTAVELANTKQLSLAQAATQDGASPMALKKSKRKPGPKKVDPDEPVIIVLDSLGGIPKSSAVRALKDYIQAEGREKRGMEAIIKQNAYYVKDNQIPMQQNLSDCGVYLLGYTEKFFKDPDGFKNRILQGEMQATVDWPDMSIPHMRETMRDLLMSLYTKQMSDLHRAMAAKKSLKSGSHLSAAQPNGTSAKTEKTPAKPGSNTTKQMSNVDSASHTMEIPAAKEPPSVSEPAPEARQAMEKDPVLSHTRLGSPIVLPSEKTHRLPSASPDKRLPTKTGNSPESLPNQVMHDPGTGQSDHLNRVTGRRRSPQVVITVSPRTEKKKRCSEDSLLPEGLGNNILGPKKQKMNHTQQSVSEPLDRSNNPALVSDQAWQAKDMNAKEQDNEMKTSKPAEVAKPRPFSVTGVMEEFPKKAAKQMSAGKPPFAYTRGSSTDPIPIEDSQEVIIVSPGKTSKSRPTIESQNSFTIEPPEQLSKQASDAFPRPVENRGSKSSILTRERTLSIVDELDLRLERAQEAERSGKERTDDELSEWNGFSPARSSVEVDDNDRNTIPDSPISRTGSPVGDDRW